MMDLFGNLEEKQNELKAKLSQVHVQFSSPDEEIKISMNGLKEVTDIHIDLKKISLDDPEQLEDLLLVTFNQTLAKIQKEEAIVTQSSLKDMMPPGFENLLG